ncbi:hypothetical protein EQG49_08650 [Periweissella cryptocerci]|uniref:DUF4097 domain-containing protein n=1 Tax=Periweissella cryptocerci TaxID=2506420 RepID=A0A4P6YUS1_9LACO|nr:DUF4097 family beta strand repeat-containing protein [Periweissella cryptocerci]QBO36538.1 hypothetical protein EQG49_08650 [Periweissella cryptocerci]
MNEVEQAVDAKLAELFEKYPNTAEMQDFRGELRSDILESVQEKVEGGAGLKTALNAALADFGDLDSTIKEISNVEANFAADERPEKVGLFSRVKLVNSTQTDLNAVTEIQFDLKDLIINVQPGNSDLLEIDEYMTKQKPEYFIKQVRQGGRLIITSGNKPLLGNLHQRLEVRLPLTYVETLTIDLKSGLINIDNIQQSVKLNIVSTSGITKLNNVDVREITGKTSSGSWKASHVSTQLLQAQVKSGTMKLDDVTAQFQMDTTSGSIKGTNLHGAGDITVKSGTTRLDFDELIGDLNLNGNSGTIRVNTPMNQDFLFDLQAKSGTVAVKREAEYQYDVQALKVGQTAADAKYKISAKVKSGTVRID